MDVAIDKELATNLIIAILSALLGALFAGLTAWILLRKDKAIDRRLLEETGAFKNPLMKTMFLGWPIGKGYPDNDHWYLLHPGPDDCPAVYPLEFEFRNAGDLVSEDNVIQIIASKACLPADGEGLELVTKPRIFDDLVKWSIDEYGPYRAATMVIPMIPPKTGFLVKLPLFLFPTSQSHLIEAQLKDGYPVNLEAHVLFSYKVSIHITTKHGPESYLLSLGAIRASKIDEAIKMVYQHQAKETLPPPPSLGLLNNFIKNFTKTLDARVNNFVQFQTADVLKDKGRSFYFMKAFPVKERVVLPLYRDPEMRNINFGDLTPGTIVSVVELETIPKQHQRYREKKGNAVIIGN